MPFIEEEKFKLMQEDLDNAKLKREEAENELTNAQEELASVKKNSFILPIILGLLFGLSSGAAYYFYTNGGSNAINNVDVVAVKKEEALRVIDSINRAQARELRNSSTEQISNEASNSEEIADATNSATNDGQTTATPTPSDVASANSGETIYSVQIGIFSEKKYPLISSESIPSVATFSNGYFKYSVGLFKTADEARALRKELRSIGFKDAFVASYIDGKRQKIIN